MERGKLGTLVDCLSAEADKLPARPEYSAGKYRNRDAVNSAFVAFFFQFPSLLWIEFMQYVRGKDDGPL